VHTLYATAGADPTHRWQVTTLEVGPRGPSPAQLRWMLACQTAADLADRPGEPTAGAAQLRAALAPPYRGRRLLFAAADEAGRPAGWARLGLYEAFHRDLAHAAITVHPAIRRRGVGSILLESLVRAARSHDRSRLFLDAPYTQAHAAFAARHGLYLTSRDLRSRLDLRNPELVPRLAAVTGNRVLTQSRRREYRGCHARLAHTDGRNTHNDFSVLCWNGSCPDEFLDEYVRTLDFLNAKTMPASAAPFTAAEVRHREQSAGQAGLREHTACLIDRMTGRIAALSNAHTADGLRAEQNETVVAPSYRGLGLAARVKAQLIRELLAAEPRSSILDTYNAEDNHRMLAVNRRLGFRPLDLHAAWSLVL
jgi:GNAT superfamily N-acetyltransferase